MWSALFACEKFAVVMPRPYDSASAEAWQLIAGLEGILIIVLLVCWLHAAARPRESAAKPPEVPP